MNIFIIPWTLIFSSGARLTYRYFKKIKGMNMIESILATYQNHCLFGQTVIDKFAIYAGRKFKINYHNLEEYKKINQRNEAFVQLSAHIGCSEILGYSLPVEKKCNVLAFGGENEVYMNYRKKTFSNTNIRIIPVGVGTTHSEDIVNALDNGEIVNAFADRLISTNKTITSIIHDTEVQLARGPFSLATTRGLDVIMASAMKEKDGSYSAFFTPLYYDKTLPQAQQRKQLANAYTEEIERLLNLYPLQWFNYYNLWMK